ncbi:MAG: hypothetical protein EPN84_04310 [Legionella sp.]|nr:MAG: hypothetical protein EPN84_04310 [Legionella sp.]
MPSSKLLQLSKEIETKVQTDHFGKFQLYLALLNSVTDRQQIAPNLSITQDISSYLPQPITFFYTGNRARLEMGSFPPELLSNSLFYAMEFKSPPQSKLILQTLSNIWGVWRRNSNIADLMFIIDQMLVHLRAMKDRDNPNQEMIDAMLFERQKVMKFLEKVSQFNQLMLSVTDDAFNKLFSTLTIILACMSTLYVYFTDTDFSHLLPLLPALFFSSLKNPGGPSELKEKLDKGKELFNQIKDEYRDLESYPELVRIKITILKTAKTALKQLKSSEGHVVEANIPNAPVM